MSLHVNLVSAQINKGADLFSKADPYVIFNLGNQQKESKVKDEGGHKVNFNQMFHFKDNSNMLKVIVMDDDTFSDDLIGEGQVDISQYRCQSMDQQVFVMVQNNGQPSGKVILRIRGEGGNMNNQWGGQQNQWGGQQNQFGGGGQGGQQWGGGGQGGQQWGGQQNQGGQWGGQQNQFGGGGQGGQQWGAQSGNTQNTMFGAAQQMGSQGGSGQQGW